MLELVALTARHWRLLAPLLAIAVVLAALAQARHQREAAREASAAASAATYQARANAAVAQITDTLHRREAVTHAAADQEIADVQTLPGAQTPLDPDRRARLCAALGRLFDDGAGGCAPEPARDSARAVPAAGLAAADPS